MKNGATVTSKGQITIPLAVRNRLGLREGDRVEFVTQAGQTLMKPVRGEDNPFSRFAGALGTFPGGRQQIKAWIRDLRDDEQETQR